MKEKSCPKGRSRGVLRELADLIKRAFFINLLSVIYFPDFNIAVGKTWGDFFLTNVITVNPAPRFYQAILLDFHRFPVFFVS